MSEPELVVDEDHFKMYIELVDDKPYLHTDVISFSLGVMKEMCGCAVFLAEKFGGVLYTYCPTPQAIKLALIAGFQPTGRDVPVWFDTSTFCPEYRLCLSP